MQLFKAVHGIVILVSEEFGSGKLEGLQQVSKQQRFGNRAAGDGARRSNLLCEDFLSCYPT